jgi:hypothetical protein
VATSSLVQGSNGGWLASGETEIFEFGASAKATGSSFNWNKADDAGDMASVFHSIPSLAVGIAHSEIVNETIRYASKAYYAEALISVGKYSKVLGAAGKILGVTGVVTSGMILWNDPSFTNLTKFGINVGSLFLKANPVGLTISLGVGLLDYTGYLDKGLNYIYNEKTSK